MNYSIFWHRRDIRINDNAGLYHALKGANPVKPIFIFDKNILDQLPHDDARVTFIHDELSNLKKAYKAHGSTLQVSYGKPKEIWEQLAQDSDLVDVFTNRDYERYAVARDTAVNDILSKNGKGFHTYKDHVIFEKGEVTKDDGNPYVVFTPFKRKWLAKLETQMEENGSLSYFFKSYPTEEYSSNFIKVKSEPMITLADMGFERSSIQASDKKVNQAIIKKYDKQRNFPAIKGTSQ